MTPPGTFLPCRIGLWGTFDLPGFDALVPRVLRRELSQRLPAAQIRASAPYGRLRPTPRDGGDPADPLGPWSPEGAASRAADLDCIIVAGAELLPDGEALAALYGVDPGAIRTLAPDRFFTEGPGEQAEGACPVFWLGVTLGADPTPEEALRLRSAAPRRSYITVTDDASRRRLVGATGIDPGIDVIPDVALLAPRLHPPDLLSKRLEYLRLMGWYPPEGAPLVVEGDRALLAFVPQIAAAICQVLARDPDRGVVLAEMGANGDRDFADALAAALPAGSTTRLPGCVGLEDLSAALAACGAYAGSSYRAGLLAFAYDRPLAILNLAGTSQLQQLDGLAELVGLEGCLVHAPAQLAPALDQALAAAASGAPSSGLASHGGPHTDRLTVLTRQLDASLDNLAEMAGLATQRHGRGQAGSSPERLEELEQHLRRLELAHEARSRRLSTERMVFASQLHKAEAEIARLRTELTRLAAEADGARQAAAGARAQADEAAAAAAAAHHELEALRATRTFRYTAELRSVYGKLRGGSTDGNESR